MTDLRELYADRAARAPREPDLDHVLARVRERAEQRAHRRRNLLAAGGGAAAVAGLVAAALTLPGEGDGHDAPAGGGPGTGGASSAASSAPSSSVRSTVLSSAAPTWSPGADTTTVTMDPSSGRSVAAPSVSTRATTTLVPVSTPKADAVAIALVPAAWRYTGHDGPVTFYGPTSLPLTNAADFSKVIVVDVHERIKPDGPNDLALAGSKGRYHTDSGVQIISVLVDSTTELDVQIPVNAHVTRSQALSIADSLQLRSKAEKTHG